MEIYIIFPFLDPEAFFLLLFANIQVIVYNVFIFFAVSRYKKELKHSRIMIISSLIALGFLTASFFIPSIGARNISQEELLTLANIFLLLYLSYFIPTVVLPSVSLLVFGWANRRKIDYFLFISGIIMLIYYLGTFIVYIINNYRLIDFPPPFFPFLYYFFPVMLLQAFILLIIHGISNRQSRFRNTGIIMVNVIIIMTILYPFLYRLVFEAFG